MERPKTLYINGDVEFGRIFACRDGWYSSECATKSSGRIHTEHDSYEAAARYLFERALFVAEHEFSVCWLTDRGGE